MYSTIAAGALNYRVREGNVCVCSAMDTGKNITMKKVLRSNSLEVFFVFLRLTKLSFVESDLFPVISRY